MERSEAFFPAAGLYLAEVKAFGPIRRSLIRSDVFYVPVEVHLMIGRTFNREHVHRVFVFGQLTAIQMLQESESHWRGRLLSVLIKHKEHMSRVFLDSHIIDFSGEAATKKQREDSRG